MADDDMDGGAGSAEGPGAAHMTCIVMEDLLDKLKLLCYEQAFLKKSAAYKPVSRFAYFTRVSKNAKPTRMNCSGWARDPMLLPKERVLPSGDRTF